VYAKLKNESSKIQGMALKFLTAVQRCDFSLNEHAMQHSYSAQHSKHSC